MAFPNPWVLPPTKDKADEIMGIHNADNRERITILNLNNMPYYKLFEMCDVMLDNAHWSNHMLLQDALSCGVPIMAQPNNNKVNSTSRLSHDLRSQLSLPCLLPNQLNKESITTLSRQCFNAIHMFSNAEVWTKAYEQAIIDLYNSKIDMFTDKNNK